jgi:transposase
MAYLKKLQIPENIRLLPQPAYSPELMPVEQIWDDIRRDYFPNRIVHSIDEVMDKLSDGLKPLASQPEKLRSMTYFPHLRLLI